MYIRISRASMLLRCSHGLGESLVARSDVLLPEIVDFCVIAAIQRRPLGLILKEACRLDIL